MEQIQSYYSAIIKHKFSPYEVRLMLKIINQSQVLLHGKGKYKEIMRGLMKTDGRNLNFAFAIRDIVGKSHNYKPVKEALNGLQNIFVEYYDHEKKIWRKSSIIYNIEIQEQTGIIKCSAAQWFIDYLLDFSNGGARVYDFEKAMSMTSVYATRLYMITSSQNKPLTYKYDQLREMLGVKDKYKRTNDFRTKVLDVAMKELEEKGVNGFTYKEVKEVEGLSKSKITKIEITPVKRELKDKNITIQAESFDIPEMIKQYLSIQMNFSNKEIIAFSPYLEKFCHLKEWQSKFFDIVDRTRRLRKNHGYLIQAVKNETILADGD